MSVVDGLNQQPDNSQNYRAPQNNTEARQYIEDNFGLLAYWINDPDIGGILLEAGYNRWSPQRLQAAIMGTNWWRNHSDAERRYRELQTSDPAGLQREIHERQAGITNLGWQLGLGALDYGQIATDAVRFGWSDAQVQDMLASRINASTFKTAGMVQTVYSQAKAMGAEYFLDVGDPTAQYFAALAARGELDPQHMSAYFQQRAKEQYTHLADVIDQGVTLQAYFDQHRQEISKLLEVDADSVDFINDARWKFVVRTKDKDTGKDRAMTVTEVGDYVRKQKDWRKTDNSRQLGASLVSTLSKAFGVM